MASTPTVSAFFISVQHALQHAITASCVSILDN